MAVGPGTQLMSKEHQWIDDCRGKTEAFKGKSRHSVTLFTTNPAQTTANRSSKMLCIHPQSLSCIPYLHLSIHPIKRYTIFIEDLITQQVNKSPSFMEPKFINVFTKAHNLTISSAKLTPVTVQLFNIILHVDIITLCTPKFPKCFVQVFRQNFCDVFLIYSLCSVCSTHPVLLDLIALTTLGEEGNFMLYNFLYSPVSSQMSSSEICSQTTLSDKFKQKLSSY